VVHPLQRHRRRELHPQRPPGDDGHHAPHAAATLARSSCPAIFPAYVTGGITAAGGAWNASIVAELVTWHHQTLHAYGLGNYIATASNQGKFALLIAGGSS
jgi:ABC-type anion transport system duplicated permease subunit